MVSREENNREKFRRLRAEIFREITAINPVRATLMGIHDHDGALPKGTRESKEREIAILEKYRTELKKLDLKTLLPENQLSLTVGLYLVELYHYRLKELRQWESNPDQPQTIMYGLLPLVHGDFAPVEDRLTSATSRIQDIPVFLSGAKSLITRPVDLWVELSLEILYQLPEVLNHVQSMALSTDISKEHEDALSAAIDEAKVAFQDYESWLTQKSVQLTEHLALSPGRFEDLLAKQKFGYSDDEITALGKDYLRESRDEMEKYTKIMDSDFNVGDAVNRVETNSPRNLKNAIAWHEKAIKDARSFVKEKNIVTLPQNESIRVIETPKYLSHLVPFGGYQPFSQIHADALGTYLVTPPKDSGDRSRLSFWSIRNRVVQEAYPGRHLEFSASSGVDDYFILLANAPEIVEGWPRYSAEMMKDYGFDDTPEARLLQARDRRRAAAKMIVTVKLNKSAFSYEEGVNFMMDTVGLVEDYAKADVISCIQRPSFALGELLGKHKIEILRENVKKKLGGDFSDRLFHDKLVYGGTIPLEFHRKKFDRFIEKHNKEV